MGPDTIFVVDDDLLVANFVAGKLLPRLGYKTLVANDGKTALEMVKRNNIALMLLDLELPDMTGLDLLRQLVRDGYYVPTIMVTGQGSEKVAVEAFRLGVQDYLIKPLDTSALIEALNRGLTQTRLRRDKERLTLQLKEQVSWLIALAKIGQSVTSTLDNDEVLRRIVAAGVELTRAQEGFLALLDEPSGQLYLRAVKNIDSKKSQTMRLPVNDSMVGSVVQSGKALRTFQAAEQPPLKVSTGYLVQSLLHVPVLSKGRVIGVLSVDNPNDSRPFSDDDEVRLTSLADYAAVALENASLYEQSQQEITERVRVELALRESEERYALAVRGANDGLWDWNIKTNTMYFSPRWMSMLGLAEGELGDSPDEWFNRVHGEDIERLRLDISSHLVGNTTNFVNEHRILHKNGSYHWVLSRGLAVRDHDGVAYRVAGSLTDITDRRNAEDRLIHDAFHDTLTGLPNRALFMDRLRLAVERSKRKTENQFAVLFLDLDQFKNVNDCLGHLLGDQMLVVVAQLLSGIPRTSDTVARFGGDEFVILLEDIEGRDGAVRVVEEINQLLQNPFMLSNHQVFITASTGVVLSDGSYTRAEDILRDADIAMYSAKGRGRATYELFEPSMRVKISERLALESELRQALERKEFLLHYQPIVSLIDGQIAGFEALLRWQHPRRGMLKPMEFLGVAEDSGLVHSIDRWVLGEACKQMKEWQKVFPFDPPLTISVNISGKQLSKPDLIDYVRDVLSQTGLEATTLKLEITESALMEHTDTTMDVLHQLRSMGVQIQIDDFGVGYSSLSYLSQFPVSALKIDQSFVNLMTSDNNRLKIIQAIVLLTQRLDVIVIAEGVETEEQLTQLKELGCGYGQGYYMSRPIDSESVSLLLEDVILNGGILTGRLSEFALAE